jgi:oxygen-dependent protoporphyrinogen oxidase
MKRIAIVGAGIAGLAAAYELTLARSRGAAIDFTLYEATHRAGGIVETQRPDGFTIECGPDSWVTEKPWARELAVELGLESEIIPSNDRSRRTYIAQGRELLPMPDGMRMMVPTRWEPLLSSPLFSWQARLAYLREPRRAEELKAAAPAADESVATFLGRHFGDEVTRTLGAPLLAGVFGGDIDKLSVQAVMPQFVKMEREHGSLIAALAAKSKPPRDASIFTSLQSGLGTLVDRMLAAIPAGALLLNTPVTALERRDADWLIRTGAGTEPFDEVILATPADVTRTLLTPVDARFDPLLEMDASSAIVIALAFDPSRAERMRIPRGFGFLLPQTPESRSQSQLLACTFVDQKFTHRAPPGAILLRAFIGGEAAPPLLAETDDALAALAHEQLGRLLGRLPEPAFALVRRWPRSLPQYAVGHGERVARIASLAAAHTGLQLIGNAYHGVGLPDLIRDGRAAARKIA